MTLSPPMTDAELWAEAVRRASRIQPAPRQEHPAPSPAPDRDTGAKPARPKATRKPRASRQSASKRPPVPLEHEEQAAFFAWCEAMAPTMPELGECFAVPNFSGRLGKVPPVAAIRQAEKLNREGRKRGVEDILLLIARGGYHGLCVEMKRQNATDSDVAPEQRAWHVAHVRRGYHVVVCRGADDAKAKVLAYLAMPATRVQSPTRTERTDAAA